jgi:cob(I)alamin adenosyltransferase
MDKKEKKRMEVLQQKIAKLQQQLAGAKKQPDDPADIPRLEKELTAAHAELSALKKA